MLGHDDDSQDLNSSDEGSAWRKIMCMHACCATWRRSGMHVIETSTVKFRAQTVPDKLIC
jgi:hypothetical protein